VIVCVVNVRLQPARVPRTPHPQRVLRPPFACPDPQGELQAERLTRGVPHAFRISFFDFRSLILLSPMSFLLTPMRTLALANSFFSHTSQKHPGVVWAPFNSCLLYELRTTNRAASAPTPYRRAIALRFAWCHNRVSGHVPVGRAALGRSGPPGEETFLCSVVSNKVSGRGLGNERPIRSAKRPVAGKRFLGRPCWRRPAWASSS
jgi:hypothetical protein